MIPTTRRGLLGMFAAGAGAAILPSGILMPVRPIILPRIRVADVIGDPEAGSSVMRIYDHYTDSSNWSGWEIDQNGRRTRKSWGIWLDPAARS